MPSPTVILGAAIALVASYGLGRWQGDAAADAACEADKNVARGIALERWANELTDATTASLANQGVALELNTTLTIARTRADQHVREVKDDVDANPDLARCLVPATTRRVRDEQVSDSARIATQDHPVQQ